MSYFVVLDKIIVVLIIIVSLWFGLWVFFSNKKQKVNKLFLLFILSIILRIVLDYLFYLPSQFENALVIKRLVWGALFLFFVFMYYFSIYFPEEGKRNYILDKIIVVISVLFLIISLFTDWIIKDIEKVKWGPNIVMGGSIYLAYIFIVFLVILILYNFFRKYFLLSPQKKKKVQYFIVGVLFFAFFNVFFNIIYPLLSGSFKYAKMGNYSAIFLIGFTAYAIVKRNLFGIKVILTEILIAIIAILLFINIFVSNGIFEYIWNTVIFVIFLIFGFFLIRSIWSRMRAREQIRKYAERLKKANDKLKKLDQQKTEFISFAAHQLRAPLTSVRGFASLVLDDSLGKTPPKIKDAMQNIFDSATSMINSVEDYLNITRIEQGRMEYDMSTFDLYEVAEAAVNELQPNAYKKKINLTLSSDKNKSYNVKGDQGKIKQVIGNLVDNAIKYTQEGEVKVYLSQGKKDGMVRLGVSDTGMGMPRETIKKLFQRYTRADNVEGIQGSGLGLFIAKKMIEAHKGRIWAESQGEDKGSVFYIELPRSS